MTTSLQLRVRAILRNMRTLEKRPSTFRSPARVRFSPLPSMGMVGDRLKS